MVLRFKNHLPHAALELGGSVGPQAGEGQRRAVQPGQVPQNHPARVRAQPRRAVQHAVPARPHVLQDQHILSAFIVILAYFGVKTPEQTTSFFRFLRTYNYPLGLGHYQKGK